MAPQHRPHVVVISPPPLGHLRPICSLAAKLASQRAIDVTLLLPNGPNTFVLGSAEATRSLQAEGDILKGTLRIVAFSEPHAITMERLITAEKDAFAPIWSALISELPIKCSVTNKEYPAVGRPGVVILSGMEFALFPIIRSSTPAPPIYAFQSSAAAGINQFLLPSRFGGHGHDLASPFTEEEKKNGRPLKITGAVMKTPGIPNMYDYELYPADTSLFGAKPGIFFYVGNVTMQGISTSDGLISANCPAFDGEEIVASMKAWAIEAGRSLFNVGPLRPFQAGTTKYVESVLSAEVSSVPGGFGPKIISFLDNAIQAQGKKSVIYICLGSMFWPFTNPEHMWALLDILEERHIPFILSHCSPFAKVPENLLARWGPDSNGSGLLVPFAPQQSVLAHPAVGWFVTHGGMGGTVDAATQGVPMIAWPFTGDQPGNIARLVHVADVAFELVEARTGPWATKPLLASGKTPTGTVEAFKVEVHHVLDDAFGDVGARKRANVRKMQAELATAWAEGGSARSDFDAFAAKHGL